MTRVIFPRSLAAAVVRWTLSCRRFVVDWRACTRTCDVVGLCVPAECRDVIEFGCDNGQCIASVLTCDGHDDCGDNSDEIRPCSQSDTHSLTSTFHGSSFLVYIASGRVSSCGLLRRRVCASCYVTRLCYDVSVHLSVTEVHWVTVHAGNTAAAPASEVEAIIRSPTNMAAADGGVISRYASHC